MRGLINSSNNCYSNVVLQTLAINPSFTIFLNAVAISTIASPLIKELCRLCNELNSSKYATNPVDTSYLLRILYFSNRNMADGKQQDATEFYGCLLNALHETTTQINQRQVFSGNLLEFLNEEAPHQSGALLRNPCQFLIASQLKCKHCRYKRPAGHQLNNSLTLAIPNQLYVPGISLSQDVSIYDCLDEYFKEEALPDVNCARCSLEKYKSGLSVGVGSEIIGSYYDNDDKLFDALGAAYTVKREALKRLGVARLPELLCLHLSRRVIDLLRGEIVKIDTHVQFPLELNMDRYLSFSTSNSVFKLVSVIHHIGTAHAGHYVNYTLSGHKWFLCSDTIIQQVSSDQVLSCQAYMLFYQRCK